MEDMVLLWDMKIVNKANTQCTNRWWLVLWIANFPGWSL